MLGLGAIHTIKAQLDSQSTLNLNKILTLLIPEAVETMQAPEQIQIILAPWENQTTLELKGILTILAPEPVPTIQAPEGIQNILVPESIHT